MQAIMETIFNVVYLTTVITIGILMVHRSAKGSQHRLFGIMAIVLGAGDAFHLVPRAWALCTIGLESYATALGVGKLITSVTMTVFYVILYHIWRKRYGVTEHRNLTVAVYSLAAARVILCLMPQNDWLSYQTPLDWGIYRNIPFAILGILMIVIFYVKAKKERDRRFHFMWLAILLSFGFYIPVVLFAEAIPLIGMLMIPKTLAYVWIVFMGYCDRPTAAPQRD